MKQGDGMSELARTDTHLRESLTNSGFESDEALAARAATDADAFAEIYLRYRTAIRKYCGFRLRDWWAVDDATSEIFVKALESLHKTTVGKFRPWLFTIAHNVVSDRFRRAKDEIEFDPDLEIPGAPSPEDSAIARSQIEDLRAAIALLTPDQARVIELRLSGLDGPEIRQVLNRSRTWVDTTQYRALKELRHSLNPDQRREAK
jgi:RNA polymerase sigma-70 factor, ECF subfamily